MQLLVKRLPSAREPDTLPLPRYETNGAAGLDLRAAVSGPVEIAPASRALIPTGLAIAVPQGYEAQVRPRSGLALQRGVTCLNSPGTIDSDYRGEVKVLLVNLGETPFRVHRGDRIAQLVVAPVARVQIVPVDALTTTGRGVGGFGHTAGFDSAPDNSQGEPRSSSSPETTGACARGDNSTKTGLSAGMTPAESVIGIESR